MFSTLADDHAGTMGTMGVWSDTNRTVSTLIQLLLLLLYIQILIGHETSGKMVADFLQLLPAVDMATRR